MRPSDYAKLQGTALDLFAKVGVTDVAELEFDDETPRAHDAAGISVLESLQGVTMPQKLLGDLARGYRFAVVSFLPWTEPPEGISIEQWAEMWDDRGCLYVAKRPEAETMIRRSGWNIRWSGAVALTNESRVMWLLESTRFAGAADAA